MNTGGVYPRAVWLLALSMACEERVDDTSACADPAPTWDTWGDAFFAQWCDSCHASTSPNRYGAPEGVAFDSQEEALAWADRIEARVLVEATMPPGGGLTDEELDLLAAWLQCSVE